MPELTQKTPLADAALAGVFGATLAAMNNGKVLQDLDDALRDATKAAIAASSKATVTLELKIVPNGTGVGDTPLIKILDKIKTTLPKPKRDTEPVFFADDNGNPTRRNPMQGEMKLTALEGGATPSPMGVAAAAKSAGGKN